MRSRSAVRSSRRASAALRMLPSSTNAFGTRERFRPPRSSRWTSPAPPPRYVRAPQADRLQARAQLAGEAQRRRDDRRRHGAARQRRDDVKAAPAGRAAVGVDRDREVGVRAVADRRPLVDARADAVVGRARHDDGRAEALQPALQPPRDVEREARFAQPAVVRLGAGRVAGLAVAAGAGRHEAVDLRRPRRVGAVVAGVDVDRRAGERQRRRRDGDECGGDHLNSRISEILADSLLRRQLRDPDEVAAVRVARGVEVDRLALADLDGLGADPRPALRRRGLRQPLVGDPDRRLEARRGRADRQALGGDARGGVDDDPDAGLVVEVGAVVVLRRPGRRRVAVDERARLVGVLAVAADRVEVRARALLERDRLQARRGRARDVLALAGPALGARAEVAEHGGRGDREHEQADHQVAPAARAQRDALARVVGQAAQDGRRLAGDVARARGLDREHVLEVGDERGGVGVAAVELLGGGAVEHRGERGGDLGAAQLHVGHVLADVLHRHGDLVLALERDVAGEHLEEHDPERVEVGLAGDGPPERLLGRDVVRRAEHAAVGGQALLVQRARDPEVGDLRRALLVDEDVLRLDVAVDDLALVGGAERAGDLDRVGDRLRRPTASCCGGCAA